MEGIIKFYTCPGSFGSLGFSVVSKTTAVPKEPLFSPGQSRYKILFIWIFHAYSLRAKIPMKIGMRL
jgi:hypothetical protein